jgi:hypothetical protein
MAAVSAGSDGTLWALDSLGNPYSYSPPTTSWVAAPAAPGPITSLSVSTASEIWAVVQTSPDPNVISQPNIIRGYTYTVYQFNGTSWAQQSPPSAGSMVRVGASTSGVAYALDSNNTAWVYSSNGTSFVWKSVPGTVYDVSGGLALSTTTSSGNVYSIIETAAYGSSNFPTFALYQSGTFPTLASLGDGSGLGIDASGNIWQLAGNASTKLPTPPTTVKQVSMGTINDIWLTDGSNHLVRYFPNSTSTARSGQVSPTSYISETGGSTIYNLLPGVDFGFGSTSGVNCSCVGSLFSSFYNLQTEGAYTQAKWLGTMTNCHTGNNKLTTCSFQVENWCTAATTPPDNDLTGWSIGDLLLNPPYQFWDVYTGCYRIGSSGPWTCFHSFITLGTTVNRIPANCTSNP